MKPKPDKSKIQPSTLADSTLQASLTADAYAGARVSAGIHMLLCLYTGQISLSMTHDITE